MKKTKKKEQRRKPLRVKNTRPTKEVEANRSGGYVIIEETVEITYEYI